MPARDPTSRPAARYGRPAIQEKVASSGATKPERPPISMLRLHSVMRCSIGIARTAEPAYSTTWPRAPATPSSAMMRSATSLAVTWAPSLPSSRTRMRFGRFIAITCVARMCVELGGAAAEGERAEPADRAGMAVGHRVGRARQHHAELRRHHVRDALLRIVDVEQPDAVLAAAFAHRPQERRARRIGVVVAAGLGGDGVVLHREGQIGPAHRPALLLQRSKACGACSSCSTWRSI